MGGRLDRERKRKHARELYKKYSFLRILNCPNCKKRFEKGDTGHFVPPSFGQRGFFYCEKQDAQKENT